MNAIETNDFTRTLQAWGERLTRPKTILCVSAHWMTEGTWVTNMARPRTIHDFSGFPQALFDVRYPAPGSPDLAQRVREVVGRSSIQLDNDQWGLDHGSWSVLRHLFPAGDIPVVQLSLYLTQPGHYHLGMGERLRPLRDEGVLVVGSGNIVHNLQQIQWEADAPPYPWATEFDEWAKARLLARDFTALTEKFADTDAGRLSVPTPEHYYPLLPVLGASTPDDSLSFPYEGIQNSSISMRAVVFGA